MTRGRLLVAVVCVAACGDNDHLGGGELLVTPVAGLHTNEAGGTAAFDVRLTAEPDLDIAVTLDSTNVGEGVVGPQHLVLTHRNWDQPQRVTVTGVDDARADGPQAFAVHVTATGSILPIAEVDVDVTNDDDDVAAARVVPTLGLVTNEGGGQALFQVVLDAEPAAPVTIPVASSNVHEGNVDISELVFDPSNWGVPQTVTIRGVDDTLADGPVAYSIVLGAARSDDPMFDGMDADDVQVTNVDDDLQAIVVTPTAGLVTTEAGGTAQFAVVLATQPTADVTIAVSTASTEVTIDKPSLVFTSANWMTPQVVTVRGRDDNYDDDDQPFAIVLAPAVSADPRYAGLDPSDVFGTNLDDDTRDVIVTPTSGLTTSERGKSDWFAVRLATQPLANVTIPIASSDTTEGTVFPAQLVFTPANWNRTQTVTVTGVNDPLADGNIAYTVQLGAATSSDAKYAGFDPIDVAVTNIDNETANITVAPTSGLVVSEFGDSALFTIVLEKRPSANVRITLASSDLAEGFVFPAQITFTPGNWNVARTITVTGVDDLATDGNQPFTIVTGAAQSADAAYDGLDPPDVAVTNIDNETPQVYVKAAPLLVTSENGTTATFQMRLTVAPAADVLCPLTSTTPNEGIVNPAGVTFTAGSFGVQTVTVIGIDDAIVDGDQLYSIVTGACSSADPAYSAADPPDVSCVNRDND